MECAHLEPDPVYSGVDLVARLCLACGEQLETDYTIMPEYPELQPSELEAGLMRMAEALRSFGVSAAPGTGGSSSDYSRSDRCAECDKWSRPRR